MRSDLRVGKDCNQAGEQKADQDDGPEAVDDAEKTVEIQPLFVPWVAEELRLSGIQGGGSGPVLDAELSENRAKMELDAVNGDGQLARDLPIRETT